MDNEPRGEFHGSNRSLNPKGFFFVLPELFMGRKVVRIVKTLF